MDMCQRYFQQSKEYGQGTITFSNWMVSKQERLGHSAEASIVERQWCHSGTVPMG